MDEGISFTEARTALGCGYLTRVQLQCDMYYPTVDEYRRAVKRQNQMKIRDPCPKCGKPVHTFMASTDETRVVSYQHLVPIKK